MSSIEIKSFSEAEEINVSFNNAKISSVNVGGQRVMHLILQPGWKWSVDVQPIIGSDRCQASHLGVIISGAICCKHDDGSEATYKSGDAYSIKPGHDAWVVGDEVAEAFEFNGMWGE